MDNPSWYESSQGIPGARPVRQSTRNHESDIPSLLGVWEFVKRAHLTHHCSSCCRTRMINRSFRGINNIKNGTFPSLSIVSSIVYTILMDLVNPGFEIFLAETLPFYSEVSPGAPGAFSSHPGFRPINGGFPGV